MRKNLASKGGKDNCNSIGQKSPFFLESLKKLVLCKTHIVIVRDTEGGWSK